MYHNCKRCLNRGHVASKCRTDLSRKCQFCRKFGHTIQSCKNRNNLQTHNVYTNPTISNITNEKSINSSGVAEQNTAQSSNSIPNRPIRTVTFNSNTGMVTNG